MHLPTVPRPKWFSMRGASSRAVAAAGGNFLAQNGDFIVQQAGDNILTQDQ